MKTEAMARRFQFSEYISLRDGRFGMDEECDRPAVFGRDFGVSAGLDLHHLEVRGTARHRVRVGGRPLTIHCDDDLNLLHEHLSSRDGDIIS